MFLMIFDVSGFDWNQRPARVESSLRFFLCSFLISFVKKPNSTRLDSKNLELDSSRNEFESRCRSLIGSLRKFLREICVLIINFINCLKITVKRGNSDHFSTLDYDPEKTSWPIKLKYAPIS